MLCWKSQSPQFASSEESIQSCLKSQTLRLLMHCGTAQFHSSLDSHSSSTGGGMLAVGCSFVVSRFAFVMVVLHFAFVILIVVAHFAFVIVWCVYGLRGTYLMWDIVNVVYVFLYVHTFPSVSNLPYTMKYQVWCISIVDKLELMRDENMADMGDMFASWVMAQWLTCSPHLLTILALQMNNCYLSYRYSFIYFDRIALPPKALQRKENQSISPISPLVGMPRFHRSDWIESSWGLTCTYFQYTDILMPYRPLLDTYYSVICFMAPWCSDDARMTHSKIDCCAWCILIFLNINALTIESLSAGRHSFWNVRSRVIPVKCQWRLIALFSYGIAMVAFKLDKNMAWTWLRFVNSFAGISHTVF